MFIDFNDVEQDHIRYENINKGKILVEGVVENPSTIT